MKVVDFGILSYWFYVHLNWHKFLTNCVLPLNDTYTDASCWKAHSALRPKQDGRQNFAGDILQLNFLDENYSILIQIALKYVSYGNQQIMAWQRDDDKSLFEPVLA